MRVLLYCPRSSPVGFRRADPFLCAQPSTAAAWILSLQQRDTACWCKPFIIFTVIKPRFRELFVTAVTVCSGDFWGIQPDCTICHNRIIIVLRAQDSPDGVSMTFLYYVIVQCSIRIEKTVGFDDSVKNNYSSFFTHLGGFEIIFDIRFVIVANGLGYKHS